MGWLHQVGGQGKNSALESETMKTISILMDFFKIFVVLKLHKKCLLCPSTDISKIIHKFVGPKNDFFGLIKSKILYYKIGVSMLLFHSWARRAPDIPTTPK